MNALSSLAVSALLLAAPALAGEAVHPGLPAGTVFHENQAELPRQILTSEAAGGRQSFLVALGNTAFSSPMIFGGAARAAGLSCNACHVNGDIIAKFFIPGGSARPGGLDPSGPVFNPRADNGVVDHVDIPSLRGIRFTAPYGRDGRIAGLREFTRQVIVGEFAGPEPSPLLLDALVAYLNEFEFLPNPKLDAIGRLAPGATPAARRGEVLFNKPFAGMGGQACASCHVPSASFIDRTSHDVGSGGLFDTPTLRNAKFTAPYFHDGRYADFAAVVEHFNRVFGLKLTPGQRADLVAYLDAVGDGEQPTVPAGFRFEMGEIGAYVGVIAEALDKHDNAIVDLVVDTVVFELERVGREFPQGETPNRQNQRPDRRKAPVDYPALVAAMRAISAASHGGDYAGAQTALRDYHRLVDAMVSNYPGLALAGSSP